MYNYIDFDFNFTFNKAMNEKVPGDRGDLLSAQVSKILIAALYILSSGVSWNSGGKLEHVGGSWNIRDNEVI